MIQISFTYYFFLLAVLEAFHNNEELTALVPVTVTRPQHVTCSEYLANSHCAPQRRPITLFSFVGVKIKAIAINV